MVDYAALAAKSGGKPDYAALAVKSGGTPATSVIPSASAAPPSNQTPGALGAISRFTGVDKLGIGLGRALNNATGQPDQLLELSKTHDASSAQLAQLLKNPNASEEQKAKIKKLLANNPDYASDAYKDVSTAGLTNKEVLGSAAQTALNIGLAGSFNGLSAGTGGLAATAAPTALKTGLRAVAGRIGAKAATGFIAGGALGTAQGLTDNKSIGASLKEGAISGSIGAILGGGLQVGSEAVRGLTAPELTEKLYNSAIGVSNKTAMSGRSPSAALIKDGVVGTAKQIYDRAQSTIDDVDPKISAILQKSTKTVKLDSVLTTLADGVNAAVGNTGSDAIKASEMKEIIQTSLPQVRTLLNKEDLTLADANKLRQIMDRTLGDRAFTGATLPFKKDALYDASNALRNLVQTEEPATKALYKQYSTAVQTVKGLNSELSKPHVLRHMLSLLAAAGGGLPGLAAGLVNEAAQTTVAKTGAAVGLNMVHNGLKTTDKSIAATLVKRFGRVGSQNAIKALTADESQ